MSQKFYRTTARPRLSADKSTFFLDMAFPGGGMPMGLPGGQPMMTEQQIQEQKMIKMVGVNAVLFSYFCSPSFYERRGRASTSCYVPRISSRY
jgi:hypothetical protein